ncbi:YwhD family protein [Pseudalkalibacillus salsuginis]|uniref:YwhD family protein n=1 Tax=Pseudalkalibacillus salsuginis TaxID=2910972 RepID=UPI001F34CAB6|nr:YwhD family protein [Pseudalkalibacillus salsuginis]MCF6410876.1 YwhD family protein [Pseudalkalibacillus salsuginis]
MKDLFNNDNSNNDKGDDKPKKKQGFTILSGDSTDGHGGYGVGTINLNNLTPVFVDPADEEVFIDLGALHARSSVEKRIKFTANRDDAPNSKLYWLVWVMVDASSSGPYYAGLGACELQVDTEARRGYKSMPEHVNNMDKALKKKVVVDNMDEKSKALLKKFLIEYNEEFWERASNEVKNAL